MREEGKNIQAKQFLRYSKAYSDIYEQDRRIKDWELKEQTARGIMVDFKKRVGKINDKKILDVGFGNGIISVAFAKEGAKVSAIEVNPILLEIAKDNSIKAGVNIDFKIYEKGTFPFENAFFDYVFSSNVIEHTNDAKKFINEISRVLKKGGLVYLSFPNRFAPKETHSGLWFITYLPKKVTEWYVRNIKKRNIISELNLHFLSYFDLVRHLKGSGLSIKKETEAKSNIKYVFKKILSAFGVHYSILLKTIMVVLEKDG